MAEKKGAGTKPAGSRRGGNVVVDLGETIDDVIDAAVEAGYKPKQGLGAAGNTKPGGYRPGFLGSNFRPGIGFRPSGIHPSKLGMALNIQRTVDTMKVLGGSIAGMAFNRVLYRAIPKVSTSVTSELLVNGAAAVLGVAPYFLFKKEGHGSDFLVGFAIPGVVTFAGSLFDKLLGAVASSVLPKPMLSGPDASRPATDAHRALAEANRTLDALKGRMGLQRQTVVSLPRVQGVAS